MHSHKDYSLNLSNNNTQQNFANGSTGEWIRRLSANMKNMMEVELMLRLNINNMNNTNQTTEATQQNGCMKDSPSVSEHCKNLKSI